MAGEAAMCSRPRVSVCPKKCESVILSIKAYSGADEGYQLAGKDPRITKQLEVSSYCAA